VRIASEARIASETRKADYEKYVKKKEADMTTSKKVRDTRRAVEEVIIAEKERKSEIAAEESDDKLTKWIMSHGEPQDEEELLELVKQESIRTATLEEQNRSNLECVIKESMRIAKGKEPARYGPSGSCY
jgi:hypothetical protein